MLNKITYADKSISSTILSCRILSCDDMNEIKSVVNKTVDVVNVIDSDYALKSGSLSSYNPTGSGTLTIDNVNIENGTISGYHFWSTRLSTYIGEGGIIETDPVYSSQSAQFELSANALSSYTSLSTYISSVNTYLLKNYYPIDSTYNRDETSCLITSKVSAAISAVIKDNIPHVISDLPNDIGYLTSGTASTYFYYKSEVDNKVEKLSSEIILGLSSDYATKEYVSSAIKENVPTKLSQLTNDCNYVDKDTKSLTNYLTTDATTGFLAEYNYLKYEVVSALPDYPHLAQNNIIYLVKDSNSTHDFNIYNEYICVKDKGIAHYEQLGGTNFYTKNQTNQLFVKKEDAISGDFLSTYNPTGSGTLTIDKVVSPELIAKDNGIEVNVAQIAGAFVQNLLPNIVTKSETDKENFLILFDNKVYTYTLYQNNIKFVMPDVSAIASNRNILFRLQVIIPEGDYEFSFKDPIHWVSGKNYTTFTGNNVIYLFVFEYCQALGLWRGNLEEPAISRTTITNVTSAIYKDISGNILYKLYSKNLSNFSNFSEDYKDSVSSILLINTLSGINFSYTFADCKYLTNFDYTSGLNTQSGTCFEGMFKNCSSLVSLPSSLNLNCKQLSSNPYSYNYLCYNCTSLTGIPTTIFNELTGVFDQNILTISNKAFYNCSALSTYSPYQYQWLAKHNWLGFATQQSYYMMKYILVPDKELVNELLYPLNTTDFDNFATTYNLNINLYKVIDMNLSAGTIFTNMFANCPYLKTIETLDTSNATNLSGMFYNCHELSEVPYFSISNIPSAINFTKMFYQCNKLIGINAKTFDEITGRFNVKLENCNNCFTSCNTMSSTSPEQWNWFTEHNWLLTGNF